MSDLQSMVAPELSAGRLFSSSFAPPFDDQNIAGSVAEKLEKFAKPQVSSIEGSASPKEMIRELAEMLLPDQPAKIHYPRLSRVLDLSQRRVRAIYNGEVSRLWDDEKSTLRRAHATAANAKARQAFAQAATDIVRGLSAAGHPLSADQTTALHQLLRVAA